MCSKTRPRLFFLQATLQKTRLLQAGVPPTMSLRVGCLARALNSDNNCCSVIVQLSAFAYSLSLSPPKCVCCLRVTALRFTCLVFSPPWVNNTTIMHDASLSLFGLKSSVVSFASLCTQSPPPPHGRFASWAHTACNRQMPVRVSSPTMQQSRREFQQKQEKEGGAPTSRRLILLLYDTYLLPCSQSRLQFPVPCSHGTTLP